MNLRIILSDNQTRSDLSLSVEKIPPAELIGAVNRIRKNIVDFSDGTRYEIVVLFLTVLREISKIVEKNPAIIDAGFQSVVLTTLSQLIVYYDYHRDTRAEIKNPKPILGNQAYSLALFKDPLQERRNKAFSLEKDSQKHPEDMLRKPALTADQDALSHIFICRDPFCSLTLLNPNDAKIYSDQVMNMLNSVEKNLEISQKLTWIAFAAGHLGLTVMRLNNIFSMFSRNNNKTWPTEIEIVLIDPSYEKTIPHLKMQDQKENNVDFKTQIEIQHLKTSLKQFFQFLASRVPDTRILTVRVCTSVESLIKYHSNEICKGSTFVECDDVWEDDGSSKSYQTNGAKKNFDELLAFVSSRSKNGAYLSVFKNDRANVVTLTSGSIPFDKQKINEFKLTPQTLDYYNLLTSSTSASVMSASSSSSSASSAATPDSTIKRKPS